MCPPVPRPGSGGPGRLLRARARCAGVQQPAVAIAVIGAVVREALAAAERLDQASRPTWCASPALGCCPGGAHLAGPSAEGESWILDQVFPRPSRTLGNRPGRAPEYAGVPGHDQPRAARHPPRGRVRAVRVDRRSLLSRRHRYRQHRPRCPRPRRIDDRPGPGLGGLALQGQLAMSRALKAAITDN